MKLLEEFLWTLLAASFVLGHLGHAPQAVRDLGAVAEGFSGLAIFVGRVYARRAVA